LIHIVMSRPLDFVQLAADVAADQSPTHVLLELARQLPLVFHQPGLAPFQLVFSESDPLAVPSRALFTESVPALSRIDSLRSKLISRPDFWALARHAVSLAGPDDTLFCTGEDVGIPVATACAARRNPPRLLVTAHNIRRPRAAVAFRLFNTLNHVTEWVTPAPSQAAYLRSLGIPQSCIHMPPEQVDSRFYTPLSANDSPLPLNPRPLIVSVGLEQRDYRTLAAATADLAVDVRISGASADATAMARAFPDPMPPNMSRQFYSWTDLRSLYRQADIVVVPLFENSYIAGINTFLEGLAHEKPVIVSRTQGMMPYLHPSPDADNADHDICLPVPPENPAAMRTAITHLLQTPLTGQALAHHGRRWLLAAHTPAHWVASVADLLTAAATPAA
jgi:glycosyltransferase involved in cell wall biosynthesis